MARRVGILLAAACFALTGCDQFARVGVAPTELSDDLDAGDVPAPGVQNPDAQDPGAGDVMEPGAGVADSGAPTLQPDASTPSDAGMHCPRPEVAVCNPVTNVGCQASLQMQCAVDLLAPGLAGYCIFRGLYDGGTCFNSGVTEDCPPTQTCYGGECRKLCFCDADCNAGQCCSLRVGNYGFGACGDC
ncbi:MAG: hypothetical protein PVI30_19510 [Myxococcales bacterium]